MICKTLITGSKGFSSKSLIKFLNKNNENDIYLTDIISDSSQKNYFKCDLSKFNEVNELINEIKPDEIYHLAGSFSNNFEDDYLSNVISTKNILKSILKVNKKIRILLIGSAAEYGKTNTSHPINEKFDLNPASVYGLTKVMQTTLMTYYVNNHNLDVVMARTFNLFGKGISKKLFMGNLYDQIEKIKQRKISNIILGDLSSFRDYIHINNAVEYYHLIMKKGKKGNVYNVGSGRLIQIKKILSKILHENNLKTNIIKSSNFRSSNVNLSFADISKLLELTK